MLNFLQAWLAESSLFVGDPLAYIFISLK